MKIVVVALLILMININAQTLLSQTQIQAILDGHNNARKAVCLFNNLLTWDDAAASTAQQYISSCPSLTHSSQASRDAAYKSFGGTCTNPTFPYCSTAMLGENIAAGSIGFYNVSQLTKMWVDEQSDFSCGTLPSFQMNSGHYSQVVWQGTARVGCGIKDCSDGFTYLLCNYYPLGNFNSQTTLAFPASYCGGNCPAQATTKISSVVQATTTKASTNVIATTIVPSTIAQATTQVNVVTTQNVFTNVIATTKVSSTIAQATTQVNVDTTQNVFTNYQSIPNPVTEIESTPDGSIKTNDNAKSTITNIPVDSKNSYGDDTKNTRQSTSSILNWFPIFGTLNDWSISETIIQHLSSTFSAITKIGTSADTKHGTDIFIVADVTPSSSISEYGLVINYKTGSKGSQYINFKYSNGVFKLCFVQDGAPDTCNTLQDIPVDSKLKIRYTVIGSNNYYRGYVGDAETPIYSIDSQWGGGIQGISSKGPTTFNNFDVRIPATVKFTLSSCTMDDTDIINEISTHLGIDSNLVLGIQKFGCNKRQASQTVTAVIVGSETTSASDLANQLVSNPSPSMTSVSIEATSINDVAADSGSALNFKPNDSTQQPASSTLNILYLVGIIVGATVGVVGIVIGIVFAVKAKKRTNVPKQQFPPTPPPRDVVPPPRDVVPPPNQQINI